MGGGVDGKVGEGGWAGDCVGAVDVRISACVIDSAVASGGGCGRAGWRGVGARVVKAGEPEWRSAQRVVLVVASVVAVAVACVVSVGAGGVGVEPIVHDFRVGFV